MPSSIAELVDLLDLEQLEEDLFRGQQPPTSEMTRVFGGQVAAQALMAACRSVDRPRHVHSLHAYFSSAATRRSRSSTTSTGSGTAARSARGGCRPASTAT